MQYGQNQPMLKKIVTVMNDVRCIIIGCLKNMPIKKVYLLTDITPPSIRRPITTNLETHKHTNYLRHPICKNKLQLSN